MRIGIVFIGLIGTVILISLGIWQVQRLAWKEAVLADMTAEFAAEPVAIPANPTEDAHEFLPVDVTGRYVGETVRVLVSQKIYGAGYRLITAMDTGDRRILVDRGFISVNAAMPDTPTSVGTIVGNLHWPNEVDSFTPDNDLAANVWFARTVSDLAAHLDTDPILVIRRNGSLEDPAVTALPVTTDGIPNDHLQYAITWFSLALIWVGMTGYFLYRQPRTP